MTNHPGTAVLITDIAKLLKELSKKLGKSLKLDTVNVSFGRNYVSANLIGKSFKDPEDEDTGPVDKISFDLNRMELRGFRLSEDGEYSADVRIYNTPEDKDTDPVSRILSFLNEEYATLPRLYSAIQPFVFSGIDNGTPIFQTTSATVTVGTWNIDAINKKMHQCQMDSVARLYSLKETRDVDNFSEIEMGFVITS